MATSTWRRRSSLGTRMGTSASCRRPSATISKTAQTLGCIAAVTGISTHRRGALHQARLALAQVFVLHGPVEGQLGPGQLHQDPGGLARLVLALVGAGAEIPHRRQRGALGGHGDEALGHHGAALAVLGLGEHQEQAAFGNGELGLGSGRAGQDLAGLQGRGLQPPVVGLLLGDDAGGLQGDGHALAARCRPGPAPVPWPGRASRARPRCGPCPPAAPGRPWRPAPGRPRSSAGRCRP